MIPRRVSIFAATEPVDMRRSFDGLVARAREHLGHDPQSGALFLFVNRDGDRMKLLWWDRNGFCILYKRLEHGTFRVPSAIGPADRSVIIGGEELAKILEGIELPRSKRRVRTAS
jgi:transposase